MDDVVVRASTMGGDWEPRFVELGREGDRWTEQEE